MTMLLESEPLIHELRQHERLEFGRRAWCEHREWTLYLGVTNISLGGMFLQTSTPFATGERLRVCLSEQAPRIVAEIEVVRSQTSGRTIGIGCRVSALAEGAEHYARLLEQLRESAR